MISGRGADLGDGLDELIADLGGVGQEADFDDCVEVVGSTDPMDEAELDEDLSYDDLVEKKKGKDLFMQLLRVLPTAEPLDYYKNGLWKDEILRLDCRILYGHRQEAGAPEPPPLEEVVMPPMPEGMPGLIWESSGNQIARAVAAMCGAPSKPGVMTRLNPLASLIARPKGTISAMGAMNSMKAMNHQAAIHAAAKTTPVFTPLSPGLATVLASQAPGGKPMGSIAEKMARFGVKTPQPAKKAHLSPMEMALGIGSSAPPANCKWCAKGECWTHLGAGAKQATLSPMEQAVAGDERKGSAFQFLSGGKANGNAPFNEDKVPRGLPKSAPQPHRPAPKLAGWPKPSSAPAKANPAYKVTSESQVASDQEALSACIATFGPKASHAKMILAKLVPTKRRYVTANFARAQRAKRQSGTPTIERLQQYIEEVEHAPALASSSSAANPPGLIKVIGAPVVSGLKRAASTQPSVMDDSKRPRLSHSNPFNDGKQKYAGAGKIPHSVPKYGQVAKATPETRAPKKAAPKAEWQDSWSNRSNSTSQSWDSGRSASNLLTAADQRRHAEGARDSNKRKEFCSSNNAWGGPIKPGGGVISSLLSRLG